MTIVQQNSKQIEQESRRAAGNNAFSNSHLKLKTSSLLLFFAVAIIQLLLSFFTPSPCSADLTIKANHDHIKIDFFYHGDWVTISGASDQGVDIVIKIASPESHQIFKKKGKAAGLLWMNTGTLNFDNVPNLYFLHSTKKIEGILSPEERDENIIGYDALIRHAEITSVENKTDKERWFKEFIRFKEASKLYKVSSGEVKITEKGNVQGYYIKIPWPYQAPPGEYTVTVYAVKDRKIIDKAETKILVEQVGIVKALASMAKDNSVLYGIISIAVAIVAGFGVGMVFRKGGAH